MTERKKVKVNVRNAIKGLGEKRLQLIHVMTSSTKSTALRNG